MNLFEKFLDYCQLSSLMKVYTGMEQEEFVIV
jgi:hypothetical protein